MYKYFIFLLMFNVWAVESSIINIQSNQIVWPEDLAVNINNKWQFEFKSKKQITITKLSIVVDNNSMINLLKLDLKPNIAGFYFFNNIPELRFAEYKFIGIYKKINAGDFLGFSDFIYKKINIIVTWIDGNTYNQSSDAFIAVFGK